MEWVWSPHCSAADPGTGGEVEAEAGSEAEDAKEAEMTEDGKEVKRLKEAREVETEKDVSKMIRKMTPKKQLKLMAPQLLTRTKKTEVQLMEKMLTLRDGKKKMEISRILGRQAVLKKMVILLRMIRMLK